MIENATSEWKYSNPPKTGEPILAQWDNNSHPLRVVHWNGFTENWNSNAQGNTKDPWRWARLNTDHVTPECKSDSWLDRVNKVFKELGLSSCTVQEVIGALTLKKENDMDGHKDENKMLNDMCKDLIAENKKLKTENERLHLSFEQAMNGHHKKVRELEEENKKLRKNTARCVQEVEKLEELRSSGAYGCVIQKNVDLMKENKNLKKQYNNPTREANEALVKLSIEHIEENTKLKKDMTSIIEWVKQFPHNWVYCVSLQKDHPLLAKWITKFPVQDIHDKYNINV